SCRRIKQIPSCRHRAAWPTRRLRSHLTVRPPRHNLHCVEYMKWLAMGILVDADRLCFKQDILVEQCLAHLLQGGGLVANRWLDRFRRFSCADAASGADYAAGKDGDENGERSEMHDRAPQKLAPSVPNCVGCGRTLGLGRNCFYFVPKETSR